MISYILRTTNSSSLHFVGHSQGFTSFLVMSVMRPKYNANIITAQAMAPVVFMGRMKNDVVRTVSQFVNEFQVNYVYHMNIINVDGRNKIQKIIFAVKFYFTLSI